MINLKASVQTDHNFPSAVTRVLILGFYDGATDGVLQFGDSGPVYRFDWANENHNPDEGNTRTFILRPLPDDALEHITAILTEYHEPKWPAWLPLWTFPTLKTQQDIERQVDDILALAGEPEWQVTTADSVRFTALHAHRIAGSLEENLVSP